MVRGNLSTFHIILSGRKTIKAIRLAYINSFLSLCKEKLVLCSRVFHISKFERSSEVVKL